MKEDLFTFSIQQAETLGIECAIVLAAAKKIKTELSSPDELTASLKEKIPFLENQEILKHITRLIDLNRIQSLTIAIILLNIPNIFQILNIFFPFLFSLFNF